MPEDLPGRITGLENQTRFTRSLLAYASRAFVIEFAGTPKSGKSTSIQGVRDYFLSQGYRVHVLVERASVCPIPMKGHLFFNTWCAASMLAELLANVETETDIILVDRGLLDALVWLNMQNQRGELTAHEFQTVESFVLLPRWCGLIDLAIVTSVATEEALIRENSNRITEKPGSIMNREVLNAINTSVDEVVQRYSKSFANVRPVATTGKAVRESLVDLAERIVSSLQDFLNPEILVVPKEALSHLSLTTGGAFDTAAVPTALKCIEDRGRFMHRHDAESNFEYVQVIPCGVLEYKGKVFLFSRKETDPKYRLYGKTSIWQGCHVDRKYGGVTEQSLQTALLAKVSRSLFLSRGFPIRSLGYCWDRDDEISGRHFGLMFKIQVDNPYTAADLKTKEFRRRRGHGLTGQFVDWDQLATPPVSESLESWSLTAVRHLHAL